MDGISILDNALNMGLEEWVSVWFTDDSLSWSMLNFLEPKIYPTRVTIANESIIPT